MIAGTDHLLTDFAERSMKMRCFTKTYCASRHFLPRRWPWNIYTTSKPISFLDSST